MRATKFNNFPPFRRSVKSSNCECDDEVTQNREVQFNRFVWFHTSGSLLSLGSPTLPDLKQHEATETRVGPAQFQSEMTLDIARSLIVGTLP